MKYIFNAVWRYIRQTDLYLILISLLATAYGIVLVYSATQGSTRTVLVQAAGTVIGLIVMVILSQIDYHDMTSLWKYIAIGSIILMVLTIIIGRSRAGSQDRAWIMLGPLEIQPSEFVKVAFVITFAKHYDMVKENINSPQNVLLLTLHGLIPVCLLILQKDMGMMLVYLLMFVAMMYAANVKLRYFAVGGIVTLIGSPLIWNKVLGATQNIESFRFLIL
jgi:rod shape determining protein RodA